MRELIVQACKANDGWLRQSALTKVGIHSRWMTRLTRDGTITRVRKGLYRLADAQSAISHNPEQDLIDAARAVPQGALCLGSALAYHKLIAQAPLVVHMALPIHMWVPKIDEPEMRIFRFSKRMLSTGVLEVQFGKRKVRIFNMEKSICDALRMRKFIGQNLAIEALKNYLQRPDCNLDALKQMAKQCRVDARLKSYLEVLLAEREIVDFVAVMLHED